VILKIIKYIQNKCKINENHQDIKKTLIKQKESCVVSRMPLEPKTLSNLV